MKTTTHQQWLASRYLLFTISFSGKCFGFLLSFLFLLLSVCLAAQSSSISPVVYIYDASGSMWGQLEGNTKQQIASSVLSDALDRLPADQAVGLVAYGHRRKGDCEDVETLVEMTNTDKDRIRQSLQSIKPLGKTPLAFSAKKVIDELKTSGRRATIVLITDGIEVCGGDLCAVVTAAKAAGVDFKLHIVGFGLKEGETEQLQCAATAGGGAYYDAADAGALGQALDEVNQSKIDEPEKNMAVAAYKNGTLIDVSVHAYEVGEEVSHHGVRTYADTGFFHLPKGSYRLVFQPLSSSDLSEIVVEGVELLDSLPGFQAVHFDAGSLKINVSNNSKNWDAVVKVYQKGSTKEIAAGRTYGREKVMELNPGNYEVHLRAMRVEGLQREHRVQHVKVKAM
ncbi:MAG: VWA domain-containing protein, partial [Bacteroidota bacterium]